MSLRKRFPRSAEVSQITLKLADSVELGTINMKRKYLNIITKFLQNSQNSNVVPLFPCLPTVQFVCTVALCRLKKLSIVQIFHLSSSWFSGNWQRDCYETVWFAKLKKSTSKTEQWTVIHSTEIDTQNATLARRVPGTLTISEPTLFGNQTENCADWLDENDNTIYVRRMFIHKVKISSAEQPDCIKTAHGS
jgi:hypothetical protein